MNIDGSFDAESRRLFAVWNQLRPPLRPSPQEIAWFAQSWPDTAGARVLVQGATPELIDLALRKKASRVVAMDINKPIFEAMRQLGRQDWSRVECLAQDWCAVLPDLDGHFDVVLGDGSLTMLDFPAEWDQAFSAVHRYLSPGGVLALRLSFQPEEPFDLESYMKEIFSRFDRQPSGASSESRLEMLREGISEIRIAFGLVSASGTGSVDLDYRAQLVRLFHSEFTARYGHWKEWETVQIGMPPEEQVRRGKRTGRGVPRWEEAFDLIEKCGFRLADAKWVEMRPAPGVMRFFIAQRL